MVQTTRTVGFRGMLLSSTGISGTVEAGSSTGYPDPVSGNRGGRMMGIPDSVTASKWEIFGENST